MRKGLAKAIRKTGTPVKSGFRSSRMDRISDVTKGVLAVPIEDQEQMNRDMKAFIERQRRI